MRVAWPRDSISTDPDRLSIERSEELEVFHRTGNDCRAVTRELPYLSSVAEQMHFFTANKQNPFSRPRGFPVGVHCRGRTATTG